MQRALLAVFLAACGGREGESGIVGSPDGYVLGSVVITPDGRTTYFQLLDDLDVAEPITNESAIEAAGNGVILVHGRHIFLGLAESPEWIRYTIGEDGVLSESGRMSLAGQGMSYIDYGNAILSDEIAVSVSSESLLATLWNPSTMEITDTIELPHLARDGYSVEVWTTLGVDGKIYIPTRWSDWEGGRIYPLVQTTIIDPVAKQIVGVAEDDRCASGGRILFDEAGYGYVMGDGRSYSAHMFDNAGGAPAAPNCILRIAPGETDFEEDYHVEVPSLTGGYESVSELEAAEQHKSTAFSWMFHPEQLPEGVEPVDFGFWSYPAFKLWSIEVGDTPTAREVEGIPFGVLGFGGSSADGKLYVGLGDTERSVVYEVDPETSSASERLTMDGYFYGLYRLQ